MGAIIAARKQKFTADRIGFYIAGYILLFAFAFICLMPFYLTLVNSFVDEGTIIREGYYFYPRNFSFEGYGMLLKNPAHIINSYKITIFVTAAGTFAALFLVTMAGFVLSRRDFYYRNPVSFFFYF